MADFCRACSIERFGQYRGDMDGVTTEESWQQGLAGVTICEGCGVIQVDPHGNCVSSDCLKKGTPGHGDTQWPTTSQGP